MGPSGSCISETVLGWSAAVVDSLSLTCVSTRHLCFLFQAFLILNGLHLSGLASIHDHSCWATSFGHSQAISLQHTRMIFVLALLCSLGSMILRSAFCPINHINILLANFISSDGNFPWQPLCYSKCCICKCNWACRDLHLPDDSTTGGFMLRWLCYRPIVLFKQFPVKGTGMHVQAR